MKASLSLTIIGLLLIQTLSYSQDDPWQKLEFGGELPELVYPTATHYTGWGYMYLYGGQSPTDYTLNPDIWRFEFTEKEWSQLPPPPERPAARAKHAAAAKDGKLYIFGGETADGTTTDAWAYDPEENSWEQQPFALDGTNEENPKHYHRACAGENNIWITGGLDLTTGQATGAIWGYNPLSETWTKGADCPSPRYGHATYYSDGEVTIIGGRRGNDLLDDAWKYQTATNTWTQSAIPPLPEAVKFPAYCYNEEGVWISGGTKKTDGGSFDISTSAYYIPAYPEPGVYDPWQNAADCPSFIECQAAFFPAPSKSSNLEIADFEVLVFGVVENDAGEPISETWVYNSANDPMVSLLEVENAKTVNIYPSITIGIVNIKSIQEIQQIEVYNIQGQLILQRYTDDKELSINLSGNVKGSYFIRVLADEVYSVSKVMLF